jgi:subtilisin-like proprotein convertase family protein
MSETTYFWQGGRKIEIKKDDAEVTIQAADTDEALALANRAGVEVRSVSPVAPGLIRAKVVGDRENAVSRLRVEEVTHHVYRDTVDPQQDYLITESFFVKFKPDTPEHRILAYIQAENLHVEKDLGNKTYLMRVTDDTGRNPIRVANSAASRDDVEYAEPNLIRQLTRFAFIPTDPGFAKQWHLHAPADQAPDLVKGAGIFAPDAWELTRGRRDIVIAVADDAFDLTHPDFQGQGKVVAQLNATPTNNGTISWDSDVSPRPGDYHGTPCLGVAVAEGNGTGVVGVAPGCGLVAVRFPLSMSDAHLVTMFQKISALADVVSCSWGVGPANATMSTAFKDALAQLARTGGRRGKGLVICVAAGNNNCPVKDLANTRTYRFRDRQNIIRSYSGPIDRWIAAHPDVLTISAATSRKTRSAYSSWGKEICVCAPSDNWDDLGLTTPAGRGIMTTDNEGFGAGTDFTPNSRFTERFGGTSSATPTVAGVCGLVLSQNSALTASEVKALLQSTADKNMTIFSDTTVNEPGDFNAAGHSLWFGHGKVNAASAVRAAAGTQATLDQRADPNLSIPDVGAPVFSDINVLAAGSLTDVRITVDISHTYIGDLRVDLVTPDGTSVALHNNSGGSTDNLKKTYSSLEAPALRTLDGKSARGVWKLRVADTARLDIGRINSWRLTARLNGGSPQPATPTPAVDPPARRVRSRATVG